MLCGGGSVRENGVRVGAFAHVRPLSQAAAHDCTFSLACLRFGSTAPDVPSYEHAHLRAHGGEERK